MQGLTRPWGLEAGPGLPTPSPPRPLLPLTLTCSTAFTEHLLSPGARNSRLHGPERSGSPKPHRPHRKTQAHTQSLLHSKNRLHLQNRGPDEGLSWVACEAALAGIQGPGHSYRGFGWVHDACALGFPPLLPQFFGTSLDCDLYCRRFISLKPPALGTPKGTQCRLEGSPRARSLGVLRSARGWGGSQASERKGYWGWAFED